MSVIADAVRAKLEPYVTKLATDAATQAATGAGAAREEQIKNAITTAAKGSLMPYAVVALILGGGALVLGGGAWFKVWRNTR